MDEVGDMEVEDDMETRGYRGGGHKRGGGATWWPKSLWFITASLVETNMVIFRQR